MYSRVAAYVTRYTVFSNKVRKDGKVSRAMDERLCRYVPYILVPCFELLLCCVCWDEWGDGEMDLLAELGVNAELRTMSLMHASFLTHICICKKQYHNISHNLI